MDRHTYVRSECPAINTTVAAERRGGWRLNKISILCYEGRSSIEAVHNRIRRIIHWPQQPSIHPMSNDALITITIMIPGLMVFTFTREINGPDLEGPSRIDENTIINQVERKRSSSRTTSWGRNERRFALSLFPLSPSSLPLSLSPSLSPLCQMREGGWTAIRPGLMNADAPRRSCSHQKEVCRPFERGRSRTRSRSGRVYLGQRFGPV